MRCVFHPTPPRLDIEFRTKSLPFFQALQLAITCPFSIRCAADGRRMNEFPKRAKKTRRNFWRDACVSFLWLAAFTAFPCPTSAQVFSRQVQSQPPTADPAKTYTITGSVINTVTGEPISRALVQIPGGQAIMTASDGSFEFTGVPDGQIYLTARKPGFFSDEDLHPGRQLMLIKTAKIKDPVVLKLNPQSLITGRITDSNGEPIENAPISVFSTSIQDGRRRRTYVNQASPNEDGEFRFSGLRPGRYFLSAGAGLVEPPSRLAPTVKAAERGLPKMYYPGVPDRAEATPIPLSPGQHAVIDLSLQSVPLHQVSVKIMGAPPTGVGVQVLSPDRYDAAQLFNIYDPDTGVHRFSVPRGLYIISASVQITSNQRQQTLRAQTQVNVTSDLDNIVLALAPTDSIPIEIRTEFTKPDSPYSSPNFHPTAYVHLIPDTPFGNDQFSQPESAQNPSPVLKDLEPGKYWVQVDNSYGYVQSLRCGSQDLTREPLTVAAGQHLPPIEIVLRDGIALLEDKPFAGAMIVLIPTDPTHSPTLLRRDQSDSDGTFALPSIVPGKYTLVALRDGWDLEWSNPAVFGQYLGSGQQVETAANGKYTAKVNVLSVR
jgi:hypothetical protein